ncbi:uncharacterized protein LOC134553781 [Prinia subflava]|uniref:uncharacterized protein LOC134553781 n=1 Tax=Prinia subflava TaxID=208062 RepID=UPI002FE1CB22
MAPAATPATLRHPGSGGGAASAHPVGLAPSRPDTCWQRAGLRGAPARRGTAAAAALGNVTSAPTGGLSRCRRRCRRLRSALPPAVDVSGSMQTTAVPGPPPAPSRRGSAPAEQPVLHGEPSPHPGDPAPGESPDRRGLAVRWMGSPGMGRERDFTCSSLAGLQAGQLSCRSRQAPGFNSVTPPCRRYAPDAHLLEYSGGKARRNSQVSAALDPSPLPHVVPARLVNCLTLLTDGLICQ